MDALIPNDVSRCVNNECKLKNDCKRWLQYQIDIEFKRDVVFSAARFISVNGTCHFKL